MCPVSIEVAYQWKTILNVLCVNFLLLLLTNCYKSSDLAQLVKNPHAMEETWVRSLGLGRSPEEGKGYPLQYSSLEDSMDYPCGHKESDLTEGISLVT